MALIQHAILLFILLPLFLAAPVLENGDTHKCSVISDGQINKVAVCKIRSLRDQYFVIKSPSDPSDEASLEATRKELRTLRRIEERLVETETDAEDFGVALPVNYAANDGIIVFPYYPYGDLESYLAKRSQPLSIPNEVPVIVQDVLNALVVLHDSPLNLHHNDIKPSNIIVASVSKTEKIMRVKLIDFERAGNRNNERVKIEGTVGYLSPEEILCYTSNMCYANYDEAVTKSDIWAFGVTLYRLIFLHEPFMFQEDLDKVSEQVIEKCWEDYVTMREKILKSEYLRTDFQEFLLGLLQWDYGARLSAAQARQHPYFIRSMYEHKRLIEPQQQRKKKSLLGSCFNCFKAKEAS